MIRIFTAFPIRDEIAESFLQLSKKYSQIEKIRWTSNDNLHLTLFFIGEVEENNLSEIISALGKIFNEQKSFSLEFDSIVFKGEKHPSMLWAMFKKNKFFSELSEKIYRSVKNYMTVVPTHLDPIPHCTLARLKPGADISVLNTTIRIKQHILNINSAELWQTVQTKNGVRYDSLEEFLMKH